MRPIHDNLSLGDFYVVGTPIGNLEDISLRALRILKEVKVIAAEDTRHTKKLLTHYGISKELLSYNSYNKIKSTEKIVRMLKDGKSVALVSDAGTPGISDPAYYLLNCCISEGVRIVPLPGPSAVISALSVSGLPTDRFVFEGFLPKKRGKKETRLRQLATEERTIVIYESAMRISATLKNINEIFGERKIVVARELTKVYEEIMRGSIVEIINKINGLKVRGEITLMIEGVQK